MLQGITKLAPTAVMLMFAILYFAVMIDTGLFAPVVRRIIKVAGDDPLKVVVGTSLLASLVSLDGDGSTTYMITIAAMLPIYKKLKLDLLVLTAVVILPNGVMNFMPWAGPLARAASAIHVDPGAVFLPMVPVMLVALLAVYCIAYRLGLRERRRLQSSGDLGTPAGDAGAWSDSLPNSPVEDVLEAVEHELEEHARPSPRFYFNAALTVTLLAALVAGVLPLPILFMLAFGVAIIVNFPRVQDQRAVVGQHAPNVLTVTSVIFAAGSFTGILSGTGMVDQMSGALLQMIPQQAGPYLATITAVLSIPCTFFMSNDAFYFGVLPVIADAAKAYGISHEQIARASLVGQPLHILSPLVPSTYLLVGLAGVEFGDFLRFAVKWAVLVCVFVLALALLAGLFPFG
jgi:CitMHS family citrate-Mg2+:H+ or citrate-Ca2+:H+ symporter